MTPTTYHRPHQIEEAVRLYEASEDPLYLSGGHTLLPTMKQGLARPTDLIDLCAIPALRGIGFEAGRITIGATTCHADVAASPVVGRHIPALAGLAGSIADRHVRHRGTIGGSLANNDPAADYPCAALGLGATIVTDRRALVADDYFVALYETALEPGEMITRVVFPVPHAAGYAKFRAGASRYAVAAVFVSRGARGVRVAVTGASAKGVIRLGAFEAALAEEFSPEAVAGLKVDPTTLLDDLNGTPDYRAHLVAVLARRAVGHMGEARSYK